MVGVAACLTTRPFIGRFGEFCEEEGKAFGFRRRIKDKKCYHTFASCFVQL
jgi:hypothetical protein